MRKRCILSWMLIAAVLCCGTACKQAAPAAEPTPTSAPIAIHTVSPASVTDGAAAAATPVPQADAHQVTVLFINVGRADATLLTIDGRSFLIDTGEDTSLPQLFGALKVMGVQALDAVFLTHTHSDHIGGMEALGSYMPVGRLYAAQISENKKNGENKIDVLAQKLSIPLTRLSAGNTVPLTGGVDVKVLGPIAYNADDDNDNSLILRLSVNGRTLLFTGDMQFAEEQTLIDAGADLKADVLKVGNHGNPDATSDAFGALVRPALAFIPTDTGVDANSANPRVPAALAGAEVHVTERFDVGALLTVTGGLMSVTNPPRPRAEAQLSIVSVDNVSQLAQIRNDGADADVSGFLLFSERGGQAFCFPVGSVIPAGKTVTVAAAGGAGDYRFIGEENPWHKSKQDIAMLYDCYGNELDRY